MSKFTICLQFSKTKCFSKTSQGYIIRILQHFTTFHNETSIHAFIKLSSPNSSRLSLHYSFDTSIGRHFVSFLTCISCLYIYLVKQLNISTRIGFRLDNFGSNPIRRTSLVYCQYFKDILFK
jgi:hypothetical protein